MKHDKLFSLLWAAVLSFCIAFGGLSCLLTGFSFQTDTLRLALFCVAFAIFAGLMSLVRWGNVILAVLLLLSGGLLWETGSLEASAEALLYQISTVYDMAYGWGTIYWNGEAPKVLSIGMALGAFAVPVIWAVVWTVMHREHSVLAIFLSLLPLGLCLVVTDRAPETGSLFLLIFGLLLLILTQTVRRKKEADGNRLTAILLIPALLCTALLFHAVPQESYTPPKSIPGWIEQFLSSVDFSTGSLPGMPDISLDLTDIGPKGQARNVIMEVTAEHRGILYLRRQSYDAYDGVSWTVSENAGATDPYWPTEGLESAGSITIKLRAGMEYLYLPYYTDMLSQLEYGRLKNELGRTYTLPRMVSDGSARLSGTVKRDAMVRQCLYLPSSTMEKAEQILQTLGSLSDLTDAQIAERIAEYVKGVAVYDLKTEKMPADATDFAIWFLEEADTGYCVHFATAATVLLRAAGVPARYVTGYMTAVESGLKNNVLANESHAWVEYLDSVRGWTVLDPTPPALQPEPTEPPEPTEDPTPTENTVSTQPPTSEPTQPSIEEKPTDTTPADTTQTTATASTGGADAPQTKDLTLLWNCLMAVVYAVLAVALILGQYLLRVHLCRRKWQKGSPNQRALACWKEIVRLSRLYHLPLSEETETLAQKAKFSQHTLTAEERKVFKSDLRRLSAALAAKPWYQRLFLKLIFAAQ